jgi:hypothetical protein
MGLWRAVLATFLVLSTSAGAFDYEQYHSHSKRPWNKNTVITEHDDRKGLEDPSECVHDGPNHCLRPKLKLLGGKRVTITLGTSFLDPGATCADTDGTDISWAVQIESHIHHDKPGNCVYIPISPIHYVYIPGRYWVRYVCTDVEGIDAVQKERLVVVRTKHQKAAIGKVSQPTAVDEPASKQGTAVGASSSGHRKYKVEGEAVIKQKAVISGTTFKHALAAAFDIPVTMISAQVIRTDDNSMTAIFAMHCGAHESLSRKLLADLKVASYVSDLVSLLHIPKGSIHIKPTASRKAQPADLNDACEEQDTFGQWSACSKSCGAGTHRRFREHTKCAKGTPHTIRFHQTKGCDKDPC